MSRVTSKLQVTVPKAIAERYGIEPGVEIDWLPAGESIRVVSRSDRELRRDDPARRLDLFDRATERQVAREAGREVKLSPSQGRGWRREELYERGRSG